MINMPCSTKHLHLLKYEFTYLNLHKYALKVYTGKPQHSPRSCCKESVMQLNGLRRRTEFRHREKQLVYLQCKPKCTYVQCRVWIQRSVGKGKVQTHMILSPNSSSFLLMLPHWLLSWLPTRSDRRGQVQGRSIYIRVPLVTYINRGSDSNVLRQVHWRRLLNDPATSSTELP